MKIHLIINPDGKVFGVYKDRGLIREGKEIEPDKILTALGFEPVLIAFDEADMKAMPHLPFQLDGIEITGLLGEGATIASLKAEAERKKKA
jgi:hypothetical protein